MLNTTRHLQRRPSLAALALAALVLALAASAPAQELSPGEASGVRVVAAPVFEASSRTVAVPATMGDDTEHRLAVSDVCTASRVGCTARLTPGVHSVRGLDRADFEGMLAASGNALPLMEHSGPTSLLRHRSAYLHSGPADVTPAPVGFNSH